MDLIIGPRGSGRTTEAIKWLLQGKPLTSRPGWSRVIVCHNQDIAKHTQRELRRVISHWDPHMDCVDCPSNYVALPHCDDRHLYSLRKAVWTEQQLSESRGTKWALSAEQEGLEYCIDDVERMLYSLMARYGTPRPAMVTLEADGNVTIL